MTYRCNESTLVQFGSIRKQEGNNVAVPVPSGIDKTMVQTLLPLKL